MKKEKKKIEFEKYSLKEKLLISCLTGFAVSFVIFLFGPIDIYANNMQEFAFTFKDIALPLFLIFLAGGICITAVLMLFQRFLLNIISSIPVSLIIASIIDGVINRSPKIVSGDVAETSNAEFNTMVIIYGICFFGFAYLSVLFTKKWKNIIAFLCVLLIGMNGASLASDFINKDLIHDNSINCDYVLSKNGIDTVSKNENIVYFLFDRFDNNYVDKVKEKYPEFFDDMEGFTYFDSAVSQYTRTFPGVSYMISGNDFTAQMSATDYLDSTYKSSSFLKDLKRNGYNINLYLDKYYEYTDAKAFEGIADNVREVTSYKANKSKILKYLIKLSVVRVFKFSLAQVMYLNANRGVTSTFSTLECDGEMYHDDDAWLSDLYDNKLTNNGCDKTFTFIYMQGSHTPYRLDENGDASENADEISQTVGSFKTIKKYCKRLKELGVYDNTTIIISGDHGDPHAETEPLHELTDEGVTTAIFIKPRNAENTKTKSSSSEVSVSDIIPTVVKDAKIKTNEDYGKSVFEINETEHRTRIFYQSVYDINHHKLGLNKYEITGNAHDIKNWKLTDKIRTEYAWY